MQRNFQACLDFTLLPANDGQACHCTAGDPGGWTSYGVTRANWSRWIGRPASVADMQSLTLNSVTTFYRSWYWNTIGGNELPVGVDLMVFDNGVLCGESTSSCQLQEILGIDVDGHIGPITIAAAKKSDAGVLVAQLWEAQEQHYRSLSSFSEFGKGWLARLGRRADAATSMIPAQPAV